MTKILLIEDDALIIEPVVEALQNAGYKMSVAQDGKIGLDMALSQKPDIILLDIMLPHMDGWEICKAVRAQSSVPIVMLTALSDEVDLILGLELGADDYLTKPFSTRELIARVRANLRRVALDQWQAPAPTELRIGDIFVDLDAHRAFKNDKELTLRHKEFELLTLLMGRSGEAVTRAELFDEVWGTDWLGDTRTLDVHIRWLREKIEADASNPEYLITVRGVGYRFVKAEEI